MYVTLHVHYMYRSGSTVVAMATMLCFSSAAHRRVNRASDHSDSAIGSFSLTRHRTTLAIGSWKRLWRVVMNPGP